MMNLVFAGWTVDTPYAQTVLYLCRPGGGAQKVYNLGDDDPSFLEVLVVFDNIEAVEHSPNTAQILCSFDPVWMYELTWAAGEAAE